MGIPGFFPRMKEAGLASVAKEIGREGAVAKTLAIIDGPAFAHYIFKTLETQRIADRTAGSGIGTPVTYKQCADEAVRWLKELERHGFLVSYVFFDGALPESKLPVRRDRLTRYAKNLDIYRKLHARLASGSSMSDGGQLKRARQDLPPLPFLVSVVLEALVVSQYNKETFVVPGEADSFCVAAARQIASEISEREVTIFTNDSDLALYDSGAKTRVALLNTAEFLKYDAGTTLLATECWPSLIATKTKCKDLVQLAFYLREDRQLSVRTAAARIQSGLSPSGPTFNAFAAQYDVEWDEKVLVTMQQDAKQRRSMRGLDARVSELCLKVRRCLYSQQRPADFHMFLPFLLEDPERTSAWRVGSEIRKLGYAVLLRAYGHREAIVHEYRRVGERVSPWVWDDLPGGGLDSSLASCLDAITKAFSNTETLSPHDKWRCITVDLFLREYQTYDMQFPSPAALAETVLCQPCFDWRAIQVAAHHQAAYYSLRILLQILRYVKETILADFAGLGAKLLGLLDTLPGIAEFFHPVPAPLDDARAILTPLLEKSMTELGWQPETEVKKKKKKRKREAETKASISFVGESTIVDDSEVAGSLAGNPFAALVQ